VKVLRLADGTRTLRLENLDTSNGSDLRVWITDAPAKEGTAGWRVFDDGKYVSLGKLKGNKGDQNYALPANLGLERRQGLPLPRQVVDELVPVGGGRSTAVTRSRSISSRRRAQDPACAASSMTSAPPLVWVGRISSKQGSQLSDATAAPVRRGQAEEPSEGVHSGGRWRVAV
jgi:hypothetical protein